jgi:hypothetical protein
MTRMTTEVDMTDDEFMKAHREDAEFFSELAEGKSFEFYVARPEDYDACNVLVLVGFKDDATLDEFRRELRRLGGLEFGGTIQEQITAVEIDDDEGDGEG